jgi:hypothetical protein
MSTTHMHSETLLSVVGRRSANEARGLEMRPVNEARAGTNPSHQRGSRSYPTGQVRRKEVLPAGQAGREEAVRSMLRHLSHLNARKYTGFRFYGYST